MKRRLMILLLAGCSAVDQPAQRHESEATVKPGQTVTIVGTVTDEGVECPAVRSADGQIYTIATRDRQQLRAGARVRVTGTIAEMSFCMQGTTISPTKIESVQ